MYPPPSSSPRLLQFCLERATCPAKTLNFPSSPAAGRGTCHGSGHSRCTTTPTGKPTAFFISRLASTRKETRAENGDRKNRRPGSLVAPGFLTTGENQAPVFVGFPVTTRWLLAAVSGQAGRSAVTPTSTGFASRFLPTSAVGDPCSVQLWAGPCQVEDQGNMKAESLGTNAK